MLRKRALLVQGFFLLGLGLGLGYWSGGLASRSGRPGNLLSSAFASEKAHGSQYAPTNRHLLQSPAAVASGREETDYGLGDNYYKHLKPYPPGGPGDRTPLDLWRYAGRGENSWGSPVLPV